MEGSWEGLGLSRFVAVSGRTHVLFRAGAPAPDEAATEDEALLHVTYGDPRREDEMSLDLALLYRGLFPGEADHSLASACAARGVAYRSDVAAVSVGQLLLRVIDEARALDPEVLQLLAYLCGGAIQDLLLGLTASPLPAGAARGVDGATPSQEAEESAWASADDVLGPEGLVSRVLPSYEVRRGQLEMAAAVGRTLGEGGALCVEAGPGTGKTFAYLVPALARLRTSSASRIVVCTRTKQLQEQIFREDLPFLVSLTGSSASTALLKGRENYLCLRRWETVVREMSDGLERGRLASLAPLGRWVFDTETGDIEDNHAFLAQEDARELWARLCDSPTSCAGSYCPHVDECFSIRARRKARKADLVVVNHSLLLSDAAARGVVLGKYSDLIVDEGHALEAAARAAFTSTLSESRVEQIAEELGPGRGGRRHGWFDRLPLSPEESQLVRAGETSTRIRSLTARVLRAAATAVGDERRGALAELTAVAEELAGLRAALRQWEILIEEAVARLADEPELAREGEGELAAVGELGRVCDVLSSHPAANTVHWYEWEFEKLALHVTPLDVAPILGKLVYEGVDSIVLTSATLSLDGDFAYLDRSLGLTSAFGGLRTAVVESPFRYESLMRILQPADMPSVSTQPGEYADALAALLVLLHQTLGRNGLVLFTSYELLFEVRRRIHERVPTLAQGIDGSRAALLDRFRRERGGMLLLGTDTFWEGIDLPGEELEYVVVTRLPFAVPTDPVFAALSLEASRGGRDAFLELALPQAVLRLRQGIGRLIRTRLDRGVVFLTDDRIQTKPYGRKFAEALPVPVETVATRRDAVREAVRWFDRPVAN